MPRTKRKHPNWPYRLACAGIVLALAVYIAVQTLVGSLTFGRRSYGVDWNLSLVAACLDATLASLFVAVGASIGSFLNVIAFRIPLGRSIGGHSGCFYCHTPIRGRDNVPVLAWIKLRGRCRTCRLPISAQYPLVELGVAIAFLVVYLSEFSTSGDNYPGVDLRSLGGGLLRIDVTSELIVRVGTYLFAMCGLIAAALIAARRQRIPLALFAWTINPWLVACLVRPDLVIVRWREALPVGSVEARLDALVTIVCGLVAAIAVARTLAPLLYPGFDRSLLSSDATSRQARQFIAAAAVAGALLGWQAVVPMLAIGLLVAFTATSCLRRFRAACPLADVTLWIWLGLLLFRANWGWLDQLQLLPSSIPTVVRHVAGALMLAPLAWWLPKLAAPAPAPQAEFPAAVDGEATDESQALEPSGASTGDAPAVPE